MTELNEYETQLIALQRSDQTQRRNLNRFTFLTQQMQGEDGMLSAFSGKEYEAYMRRLAQWASLNFGSDKPGYREFGGLLRCLLLRMDYVWKDNARRLNIHPVDFANQGKEHLKAMAIDMWQNRDMYVSFAVEPNTSVKCRVGDLLDQIDGVPFKIPVRAPPSEYWHEYTLVTTHFLDWVLPVEELYPMPA